MSKLRIRYKKTFIKDGDGNLIQEDVITPKRKGNRLLAVIMLENHGLAWIWVNRKKGEFRFRSNTYFIIPEGVYISDNRILYATYLEGISTPLTHKNIEKEQVTRHYTDPNGATKEVMITQIKGLKYDSEVIDMLLNRKLADEFTRVALDLPSLIIMILLVGVLITGIATAVISYVRV